MISPAEITVFLAIAVAVVVVWYLMARYIGVLAGARGQDESYWFRLAVVLTPMLALILLVTTTPPPR